LSYRRQISDDEGDENTILIRRTLRSGQNFYYQGNVVVIGDINPGAELVAKGDVVVMGQMRGMVHAGSEGDESATVMAFRLQPTQLRIANHITRPPDGEVVESTVPEIARIRDGMVTIENYSGRL
jgi:septum site-determining protein MinC